MSRISKLKHVCICPLMVILCTAVANPHLEMGVNDDWSYIWSARVLADTGHVIYNGWETTMLGWQLYLGACFIKLFGFSFFTVRVSTLFVSVLLCGLLQRLFVRLGSSEWNSSVATSALVLSPLFLPLEYSFMSDIQGLFIFVLCFYGCVRAVQAETDARATQWLMFAALSNIVGGSVRQIAWLGALVVVPCTAWVLRRRKGVVATGVLLWITSVAAILGMVRWFQAQPYTIAEPILLKSPALPHYVQRPIIVLSGGLEICLLLLPLSVAFVVKVPVGLKRSRNVARLCGAVIAALILFVLRHRSVFASMPFAGPYLTPKGIALPGVLGAQPTIIGTAPRVFLTILAVSAFCCLLAILMRGSNVAAETLVSEGTTHHKRLSSGQLRLMLGPFGILLLGLLITRSALFDRYLLPVMVLLAIVQLRVFQERIGGSLPPVSVALVVVFALYGVASVHDLYAQDRARIAAAEEILSTGVQRKQIRAGFEYDGTTELEAVGFVNESRIKKPVGAYVPSAPNYTDPCVSWFSDRTPAIDAKYVLARDAACFGPSKLAPVVYQTWLPWRKQVLLIREVPQK